MNYNGEPSITWLETTHALVIKNPLFQDNEALISAIDDAWGAVWQTQVGAPPLQIAFADINPRAQIIGDFFENMLTKRLSAGLWRRGSLKEKDLVYLGDDSGSLDIEIKTSGQPSNNIFGNRSYIQNGNTDSTLRKKRSGYYLCINFYNKNIHRVRVGWIDAEDWVSQTAATGQMASLKSYVYDYKLIDVPGPYMLSAHVATLHGIGQIALDALSGAGVYTIKDVYSMLNSGTNDKTLLKTLKKIENTSYYQYAKIFLRA